MVWRLYSWNILGMIVPINHGLNATPWFSSVAEYVHLFSRGYLQHDSASCHKADAVNMTIGLVSSVASVWI